MNRQIRGNRDDLLHGIVLYLTLQCTPQAYNRFPSQQIYDTHHNQDFERFTKQSRLSFSREERPPNELLVEMEVKVVKEEEETERKN